MVKTSNTLANKNVKSLSKIKTRDIRNYFESLSSNAQKSPVVSQSRSVDSDKKVEDNVATTRKERVVDKVDIFESMMRNSSRGGTQSKTPRKKVKGKGIGSTKKK